MKKKLRPAWVVVVVLALGLGLLWFYYPLIVFRLALSRMPFAKEATSAVHLRYLNTYNDRVNSSDVHDMYDLGCRHLDAIRGQYPRRTFKATDEEGYCGVFSVVQFPRVHMCVGVFGGNDSDMIDVLVVPGKLSWPLPGYRGADKVEELSSDGLPNGIIRPW